MTSSTLRPDVTIAQKVAVLIAGIPVISNLLAAFDVYSVTPAQQQALSEAVTWGGVVAGALIAGDAAIRAARNTAQARVDAVAMTAAPASVGVDMDDELVAAIPDTKLPTDEEEFASPPPDASNTPIQPSQDP